MHKVYMYRPPFKNLIMGLLFLMVSLIFGMALRIEPWWVKIMIIFFFFLTLAAALAFLVQYFMNVKPKQIILTDKAVELPFRWNKVPAIVSYNDITDIAEFETYAQVMEIETEKQSYMIDGSWMKNRKEFIELFNELKNKIQQSITE